MITEFHIQKTSEQYKNEFLNQFLDNLNEIRSKLEKTGVIPLFILDTYGLVIMPVEEVNTVKEKYKRGKFE